MEGTPPGWYEDPDPLPKTSYPARWWDGERWGDEQAWFMASRRGWVRHGSSSGRFYLFARQRPLLGGIAWTALSVGPIALLGLLGSRHALHVAAYVAIFLIFPFLYARRFTREGDKPAIGPPPPRPSPASPGRGRSIVEA